MARSEVDDLAERIVAVYRDAWEQVVAEQLAIADDPARFARAARLRETQRRIEALMGSVDAQARQWLATVFPRTYEIGGLDMAASIGNSWVWTQADIDGVTILATDLFDDLLAATRGVKASTKRFIRDVIRIQTQRGAVTGKTAVQIAKEVTALVRDKGIHSVTYSGGRRVGLASYADMAVRTKTAVSYNASALLHARRSSVSFIEVFDGVACGWTYHNDPDTANGSIRPLDEAMGNVISHPRCRRAFGARLDVTNPIEAVGAQPSTTAAQRIDQAQAEADRAARIERRRRLRRRRTAA